MTDPSPRAEEWELRAQEAYQARRFGDAAAAFEAACHAYRDLGEPGKAAEMANNLSVSALLGGDPRRALQAVAGTVGVFHDIGDLPHEARAWGNLASAQEACGDLRSAEVSYRRAIDLFTSLGDEVNRTLCLRSLSRVQLRRGRAVEASLTMQSALGSGSRLGRWLTRLFRRLPHQRDQR